MEDEVVRGSIVLKEGEIIPPAPRPAPPPAPVAAKADAAINEVKAITPWQKASREVGFVTGRR